MKKIIKRNGEFLNIAEARALCKKVKEVFPFVQSSEHLSVCGYPTEEAAKNANLQNVVNAHKGYIFTFIGCEYVSNTPDHNDGYRVLVIGFKELPPAPNFEEKFPNYIIIG